MIDARVPFFGEQKESQWVRGEKKTEKNTTVSSPTKISMFFFQLNFCLFKKKKKIAKK